MEKIFENGAVIDASVLDITTDQIAASFYQGLRRVAALCFTLNYPTIVNVPHNLLSAYKKALSLGLGLGSYTWEGLETVKKILENPGAFAAAAGGGGGGGAAPAAAAVEKEETPEKSSSAAPQGGMFDNDSSDDSSSE